MPRHVAVVGTHPQGVAPFLDETKVRHVVPGVFNSPVPEAEVAQATRLGKAHPSHVDILLGVGGMAGPVGPDGRPVVVRAATPRADPLSVQVVRTGRAVGVTPCQGPRLRPALALPRPRPFPQIGQVAQAVGAGRPFTGPDGTVRPFGRASPFRPGRDTVDPVEKPRPQVAHRLAGPRNSPGRDLGTVTRETVGVCDLLDGPHAKAKELRQEPPHHAPPTPPVRNGVVPRHADVPGGVAPGRVARPPCPFRLGPPPRLAGLRVPGVVRPPPTGAVETTLGPALVTAVLPRPGGKRGDPGATGVGGPPLLRQGDGRPQATPPRRVQSPQVVDVREVGVGGLGPDTALVTPPVAVGRPPGIDTAHGDTRLPFRVEGRGRLARRRQPPTGRPRRGLPF